MNRSFKVATVVGCLVASLLITWLAWEMAVDGRAFQCTDAGTLSLGFWTSADTHQSAGDQIQPGWTWEKVRVVNGFYKLAFLAMWLASSMLALRSIPPRRRPASYEYIARIPDL